MQTYQAQKFHTKQKIIKRMKLNNKTNGKNEGEKVRVAKWDKLIEHKAIGNKVAIPEQNGSLVGHR